MKCSIYPSTIYFSVPGAPNGVYDNIFAGGGWAELDDSPVSYHVTEVLFFRILLCFIICATYDTCCESSNSFFPFSRSTRPPTRTSTLATSLASTKLDDAPRARHDYRRRAKPPIDARSSCRPCQLFLISGYPCLIKSSRSAD